MFGDEEQEHGTNRDNTDSVAQLARCSSNAVVQAA
jgi:hypothetical protein